MRSREVLDRRGRVQLPARRVAVLYDRHRRRPPRTASRRPARRPAAGLDAELPPHGRAELVLRVDGPPARRPARPARTPLTRRRQRTTPRRWKAVRRGRRLPDRLAGAGRRLCAGAVRPGRPAGPGDRAGRRGAAGTGRRRALVPHAVRPGRPAHLALRAAVPPPAGRRHAPRAGRHPGHGRAGPASPSRARSCTRSGTASWPTSGRCRTGATTARSTPPRSSWCSSAPTPSTPATPALARRLEPHARAAVGWMFRHGGLDGARLSGLPRRPGRPRQPELEGLPRRRLLRRRHPAERRDGGRGGPGLRVRRAAPHGAARPHGVGTTRTPPGWSRRPADLRDRFQRDFWMPEQSFPALALDGGGRQVDTLASDAGHLLWSGLLDKEYGAVGGAAAAGAGLLLRLGRPHAGVRPGGLPPALLPPGHGLAARQRPDHPRPGPVRPARRGPYGGPRPGGRGGPPATGCPRCWRVTAVTPTPSRCPTRTRACGSPVRRRRRWRCSRRSGAREAGVGPAFARCLPGAGGGLNTGRGPAVRTVAGPPSHAGPPPPTGRTEGPPGASLHAPTSNRRRRVTTPPRQAEKAAGRDSARRARRAPATAWGPADARPEPSESAPRGPPPPRPHHRRRDAPDHPPTPPGAPGTPATARDLAWTTTALAAVLVLGALLMPATVGALSPAGSPGSRRRRSSPRWCCSRCRAGRGSWRRRCPVSVLGALTVLNLLDMGFTEYLGRGFNWCSTGGCWTTRSRTWRTRWAARRRDRRGRRPVRARLLLFVVTGLADGPARATARPPPGRHPGRADRRHGLDHLRRLRAPDSPACRSPPTAAAGHWRSRPTGWWTRCATRRRSRRRRRRTRSATRPPRNWCRTCAART